MDSPFDFSSIALVGLAGLLGAVIGIEREIADKPAGLRTHIFVAVASALLVLLAKSVMESFQRDGSDVRIEGDPIRIIQAIIIGISFLGTGTIIHQRGGNVEGLTTAASLFLTAGIGIAVGVGRVWLAAHTTLLALVILVVVSWIERRLLGKPPKDKELAHN